MLIHMTSQGLCDPSLQIRKLKPKRISHLCSYTASRWQSQLSLGFPSPSALLPFSRARACDFWMLRSTFLSPACSELGGDSSEQACTPQPKAWSPTPMPWSLSLGTPVRPQASPSSSPFPGPPAALHRGKAQLRPLQALQGQVKPR